MEARPLRVFVNGASNVMGAGAGIDIVTLEGIRVEHSFRLGFKALNNEVEYEALLIGLRAALCLRATDLEVYSDSRLVVSQIEGSFETKDPRMISYLKLVKQTMSKFQKTRLVQISQGQNKHADSLATLASSLTEEVSRLIKMEVVKKPSIDIKMNVWVITVSKPCWMDPIIEFLVENHLPSEGKEVERVRRVFARFWLSKDHRLYRKSFKGPYLLCLHPNKVNELLIELHEGVCGNHVEGQSLAHRAMTQGFWWPKMQRDAANLSENASSVKNTPL